MGQHHHKISVSHVERSADALATAAEQLTKVAFDMKEGGLEEAIFAWATKQDDAIGLVVRLCRGCIEVLPEQLLSKRTGIPSPIEREKERSQKQIEARRQKKVDPHQAAKRGRPRKAKA